jgi:transcriptional regulator of met regulon
MSKGHRAITFSVPADLVERIDREIVRRTVERGGVITRSKVLCDALDRALNSAPKAEAPGSGQ